MFAVCFPPQIDVQLQILPGVLVLPLSLVFVGRAQSLPHCVILRTSCIWWGGSNGGGVKTGDFKGLILTNFTL